MMMNVNMEPLLAFDKQGIPIVWYLIINHSKIPHFYQKKYHGDSGWTPFELHGPIEAYHLKLNKPICLMMKNNQLVCRILRSESLSLALCEYYLAKKPLSFPTNDLLKMDNIGGIAEYIRSGGDFAEIWSELDLKTQYQVIEHLHALDMLHLGDISDFPQIWHCSRQSDLNTAFLGLLHLNICLEEIILIIQKYPERVLALYLLFNKNIFEGVDDKTRCDCLQKLDEAIYQLYGSIHGEKFIAALKPCIDLISSPQDKIKAYRKVMGIINKELWISEHGLDKDAALQLLTDHVLFMAINYQLSKNYLEPLHQQINQEAALPFLMHSISPDLKKCQKLFQSFMNQELTPTKANALKKRLQENLNLLLNHNPYLSI